MLDNKETLLTESNLHQQQHLQYQQEDFETILTIEASSTAHGPIRDECGNNIFGLHEVYGIINARDDITFTSDSSDISAHQLELLTPTIGETSATALKADLETLKAIHAEYKAKRNSLRRALRYNPYRSLFHMGGELCEDIVKGGLFDVDFRWRNWSRAYPFHGCMPCVVLEYLSMLLWLILFAIWLMLWLMLMLIAESLLFYVVLPLFCVLAILDFVFFFRLG
jgi:hypothetical protein